MKPKIVPVSFATKDDGFEAQMAHLRRLFGEEVAFLPETPLGQPLPAGADAVVFPQFLGEGYSRVEDFARLEAPILVITSEFGTLSMWDWELISFLREAGIRTLAPYSEEQARIMFRAIQVRSQMQGGVFLMYQDNPGEGQQASIFKRFWWWEEACQAELKARLGVQVRYKSYRELGQRMAAIPDAAAMEEWRRWDFPTEGLSDRAIASAAKLFLAVEEDAGGMQHLLGAGINCLNESHFSDTTPCIAWNMFFERYGVLWACEADIVSLATKYIVHKSLDVPIMMTNIYPFLMGMAALKHEKIPSFPAVTGNPDDHILVAHCGYFGLAPKSFCSDWCLRPRVLGIVDANSHVMDTRFPKGPVTFTKLDPHFRKLFVMEGRLKDYVQYPGSDCANGGIIEVRDGHKMMRSVYSHHKCLATGHQTASLRSVADVFGLAIDEIRAGRWRAIASATKVLDTSLCLIHGIEERGSPSSVFYAAPLGF